MARNDPMKDGIWSETPGIGTDFEDMLFEEIEADDLLWLQGTRSATNQVHRKIDDYSALNIKFGPLFSLSLPAIPCKCILLYIANSFFASSNGRYLAAFTWCATLPVPIQSPRSFHSFL